VEVKARAADDEALQGQSARVDGRGYSWARRWEVGTKPPQHLAVWQRLAYGDHQQHAHAADAGTESRLGTAYEVVPSHSKPPREALSVVVRLCAF
jgi:hypothetical protein